MAQMSTICVLYMLRLCCVELLLEIPFAGITCVLLSFLMIVTEPVCSILLLQIRDVRNGFFKFGSVLIKTAGSVRF